jgi:hypothetical protein
LDSTANQDDGAPISIETTASGPTWQRKALFACVFVAIALLGCLKIFDPGGNHLGVNVSRDGDTTIYRLEPWMALITVIPSGLLLALGIIISTIQNVFSRLIGVMASVLAAYLFVISFSPLKSELKVSSEGFSHTAGFWWNPQTSTVRFADLKSIEVRDGRKSRGTPSFVLECHDRDGSVTSIPKSTVLSAGLKVLVGRAMQQGILVNVDPAHFNSAIE